MFEEKPIVVSVREYEHHSNDTVSVSGFLEPAPIYQDGFVSMKMSCEFFLKSFEPTKERYSVNKIHFESGKLWILFTDYVKDVQELLNKKPPLQAVSS